MLVDGTIEIFSLALDLNIGLIQPPTMTNSLFVFTKGFFDARCIMHDPALNGTVIYSVATLLHQFLQVAIAERISDIPPDAL